MKLSCLQKDLAKALNITSRAVSANSTLPVLNNVLLKAEKEELFFTATNLEIAIKYSINAEIKEPGAVTIPSRLFTNYINYLKDEKVDVAVKEDNTVHIKTNDSKTDIKGITPEEFPSIPGVEKEGGFRVSVKDISEAVTQVSFAAALNTTRPVLTGVSFKVEEGDLLMAATDSYRLAEKRIGIKELEGEVLCIVPVRTILELGGILSSLDGVDDDIDVAVSKNQILFKIKGIEITSRLIEGQYPDYKQVIPKEVKTKACFKTSDLTLAIKRINLFAKENNNKVLFKISPDNVNITTNNTQYGVGEVDIATKVDGENNEIALNSQFILDVLSNIHSDRIIIELDEGVRPAVIKPQEKEGCIHVIMPLKI